MGSGIDYRPRFGPHVGRRKALNVSHAPPVGEKTAFCLLSDKLLAQEDEKVGQLLISQGQYRYGIYFLVQAMEKYVRSTIFGLVNPNTDYFRQRTLTHNLDDLLAFLREIVCSNAELREQVRLQMQNHVLGGVRFGALHNDLRYPKFDDRHQSYSLLSVGQQDADITLERLQTLKRFLKDIHQLQR